MSFFPSNIYQKAVIVTEDETVSYEHKGENFHLKGQCFDGLAGKTVLVNAGLEVFRTDKKLGNAVRN